ncbi:MAG: DNA adenine methylase [Candidatus Kapaibacteriota bacterium]
MRLLSTKVKPFLKWAGGKSQLLTQITPKLPTELKLGITKRYVEPFIGGGAMFFHIATLYETQEFVICDINPEVILCYRVIQKDVQNLLSCLDELQCQYNSLALEQQERLFYEVREQFNSSLHSVDFQRITDSGIKRVAQTILLNHTCFNGLFRVNSKGGFNVPFGKYKNPTFHDRSNLLEISEILQDTQILCGDFSICNEFADSKSFYYFDPPYRPISATASFTSYSTSSFNDFTQKRLAENFRFLDKQGANLMLSNSNPKNENINDDFFERLYEGFNILTVMAGRAINSQGSKRGQSFPEVTLYLQ